MAKASYCNHSFVFKFISYLDRTIVTLTNYNNIICNFKKEESDT